CNSYADSNVLF
nr:immunoglobulin light chain junction region [Macaca mulatta]MPO03582.1 immunoglobulin light chain junction region [Macaca mulatta]MPO03590.1 immunoglobulin light chain junction region [Macaca mulatta]MPO03683.1 immunoglobulin light chain junction region [Macaca mulatta]MPO03701.1 immunoglobulin light chain junction region [Macaca mulatta]